MRAASPATPFWLKAVLTGNLAYIAAVRLTDDIAGPVGKRARLSAVLLLALRDAQAPPGLGSGAFSSQQLSGGLTKVVASRREGLYRDFCCLGFKRISEWTAAGDCFNRLRQSSVLRRSGCSKYIFSETLNGICDRFKHSKLAAGWGSLTRWEEEEPVDRSMVMPEALFKAAVSVGLLWRWAVLRSCRPFGFSRAAASWRNPCFEKAGLDIALRRDLIDGYAFGLCLRSEFQDSAPPLFDCSPNVFRRRWGLVFEGLGVPAAEGAKGIAPKSLRGSGATWLYQVTEDVERIQ